MRKLKGQAVETPASGPAVEGFTLANVLGAFAALGEAFEAAAAVRQGKEQIAIARGALDRAARHGAAAEAYDHAARQLLDLVDFLEHDDPPWERALPRADEARA